MNCSDGFRVKVGAIGMDLAYGQAEAAMMTGDVEDFKRYVAGMSDVVGISIRIPF